jgi:hypothetical protein
MRRLAENEHGMTPLLCAAERCQATMVEFFIGKIAYKNLFPYLPGLVFCRPCIIQMLFCPHYWRYLRLRVMN